MFFGGLVCVALGWFISYRKDRKELAHGYKPRINTARAAPATQISDCRFQISD
jgi:hypothetical protein